MRIKNKDIAEALGISTTAVSLAINNKPGVSEETRRKVLKMISDTAVKSAERGGTPGCHHMIILSFHKKNGLIINDKPFFTQMIETIQREAMSRGVVVAIANYVPGENISDYMAYIRDMNADGIIVMGTEMDDSDLDYYLDLCLPLVVLDSTFDSRPVNSVSLDDVQAFFRAVRYAVSKGHKDIGFLKGEFQIQNFKSHFEGYKKGLRVFGLEDGNHPVIELPVNMEEAKYAMDRFLDSPPAGFRMPTIFIADLDYIALGAMKSLQEHGYRIPDDVSVIGYDDISSSAVNTPPLTTTRVNQMDVGRFALRRLLEIMDEGSDGFYLTTHVSSVLIERESVKDLRN